MSTCENCGRSGFPVERMYVGEKDGVKLLVGSCCVGEATKPMPQFNASFSAYDGFKAEFSYAGLNISYARSMIEISKDWESVVSASDQTDNGAQEVSHEQGTAEQHHSERQNNNA